MNDDRGVSIAVNHVMTIAITTVLVVGLLAGAGAVLDGERERSAEQSLETIGERLAADVASVDRLAKDDPERVTINADHPRTVSGSSYTIEPLEGGECAEDPLLEDVEACLRLSALDGDAEVTVPLAVRHADGVDGGSIDGGPVTIGYESEEEGNVTIEGDTR